MALRTSGDADDEVPPVHRFGPRRRDIRDTSRWSQFGYHNRRLRSLIHDMVVDARLPARATVLDYGCADQPYRSELPRDANYVGADLPGNPDAQLEIDADGRVPMVADTADLVLSTQVLEHVADPALYLAECFRVLRPGGRLILSTHGIMYFHPDPEDHWRWTRTGLTKIVEAAGFDVVGLHGVMGLVSACLQLIQDGTIFFLPTRLRRWYAGALQALVALADRIYDDETRIDNGLVIAVAAVKPDPAVR